MNPNTQQITRDYLKVTQARVDLKKNTVNSFFTNDLVNILDRGDTNINLVPHYILTYINKTIEDNPNLNDNKYWFEIIDLYTYMISNKYNVSNEMKSICGTYNTHIKAWIEMKICWRTGYEKGVSPFQYHFTETTDYYFLSYDDYNSKELNFEVEDLSPNYIEALTYATIDMKNAIIAEFLELITEGNDVDQDLFISRVNLISAFNNKRYIKYGTKVERWYNSFILTRIIRKYVMLYGNYFYEFDLANSQPTLLANLLLTEYKLPVDDSYIRDTADGTFYNKIMECSKIESITDKTYTFDTTFDDTLKCYTRKRFTDRDIVKKLCYQNIFFAQNTKSTTYKIFTKLYPKTASSLNTVCEPLIEANKPIKAFNRKLKKDLKERITRTDNYLELETLAEHLQNFEAKIFLSLDLGIPYFTMHDSVYCTDLTKYELVKSHVAKYLGNNFKLTGTIEDSLQRDKDRVNFSNNTAVKGNTKINNNMIKVLGEHQHRTHKKRSNSNEDQIKELKAKGYKASKIAKLLDMNRTSVYKYYNK